MEDRIMTTKKRNTASKAKTKRPTLPPTAPTPPLPVPELVEDCRPCTEFQYAVKLVQGSPPALTNQSVIAPGRYFTAINVHNPSTCKTLRFRWKVALADIAGRHVSRISAFQQASLRPDEALEIDAGDISKVILIPQPDFVKGFVVIESPCELDVVAVYTVLPAAGPASQPSGVVAFHTERVPARTIEACLDLKLDISTGVARWTITSLPAAAVNFPAVPYQAVVLQNANALNIGPAWNISYPGALWVSARALVNSGLPFPAGFYIFRYCFTLCSGFTNPALKMDIMVDDKAWIRFNGVMTPPYNFSSPHVPWSLAGPPISRSITSGFLPGRNCLELLVYNDPNSHPTNPVGLYLRGEMTAERGACREGCGCCS
jgi:hypothetical protein